MAFGMAETAELAVKLSLDGSQFSKTLSNIDRRLGAFSGAVNRNLGRVVDAGIARGARLLADAFRSGVDALREDKVVAAQTAAVIKSTGVAAGLTARQIEAMSGELSRLNGVQDDVVQGTANILLTFTKISGKDGVFEQATQGAIDMAAALGGDSQKAALQLGKALNDPIKGITALRRVGVQFTDEQIKQIGVLVKSGKTLDAQKIILKEIQREFGGVAKAQADADPGRRLALATEQLQKAFATNLLPVVEKIQTRLTEFFNNPQTVASVRKIGDAIAALFTDENLSTAAGAIETAAKAVKVGLDAFNSLPPEVKAIAIGALTLNKVTGGALGSAASAFGNLIGAGLKQIFAANVTVIGTNVNSPGGGGPPAVPIGGGNGSGGGGSPGSIVIPRIGASANGIPIAEIGQQFEAHIQPMLDEQRRANGLLSLIQTSSQSLQGAIQRQTAAAQGGFSVIAARQSTANAALGVIAAKKTEFNVTIPVNVQTAVTFNEIKRVTQESGRANRSSGIDIR